MSRQTINEYLNVSSTWPIKEKIKHEIVLMPTKNDIKSAIKGEPMACALHNAACRMYDIPNCAIGGRWAYIPQRDNKGKMYIARMQATKETQQAIIEFDKTGEMPEAGFRFIPIAPSHRFAVKRAYNKQWIANPDAKPRKHQKHRKSSRCIPRTVTI